MPFIKFHTTEQDQKVLKFLNAKDITEVTVVGDTVCIFVGDRPGGQGIEYRLTGFEGREAMKILDSLASPLPPATQS
ncbi:MAG: hypothetical protein HYS13_23320 [Planctomycetia bacterium]|nr:hypothetical protein [Planctomycetia bacterium]